MVDGPIALDPELGSGRNIDCGSRRPSFRGIASEISAFDVRYLHHRCITEVLQESEGGSTHRGLTVEVVSLTDIDPRGGHGPIDDEGGECIYYW